MKKRGFTLVELMVVIAIIAVLAAVAAPQVFRQMSKGRTAGIESFHSSVKTAANAYLSDTAVWPVNQAAFNTAPVGLATWDGPYLSAWQGNNPWAGVTTYLNAAGTIFGTVAAGERYIETTLVPGVEANRIDSDLDGLPLTPVNGQVRLLATGTTWTVRILISRDGPVS